VGIDLSPGPRKRIGVLLEDTRLPPFLSVRAALTTVCGIRGLRGRERSAELDRVVAQARVEELLEQRVAVLSKGQARRVGLAATLVGDPPLLILDEPSAGLDVAARVEFNELVRELADDSRTILIASHLLSDIERTCTHVAIVQAGRIRIHERAELLLREARERQGEKDFHVDATWSEELARLEIRHEPSRYPGQVLLVVEEPEHELLGRLAAHRIVPSRIEPRADLVSIYLEVTGEGSE
jgi:ABC-type multidrug transport system ATPase subunit